MRAPRVVAVPCALLALLCAAPRVPAQSSVATGFPPDLLSPALAILGTTSIEKSSLDSGDVNEDGLPDVVTFNRPDWDPGPRWMVLYLGTPGGDLSAPVFLPLPLMHPLLTALPHIVDVDADGDLDILGVYVVSTQVAVLLGHGDGSFEPAFISGGGDGTHGAYCFDVGDVDGDGFPDIVFSQGDLSGLQYIEWLRGRGDGGFDPLAVLLQGRRPRAVLLRDFDADGVIDLAFMDMANLEEAFVVVHRGLGAGAFAAGVAHPVGEDNTGALIAADANGDGRLDLYNQWYDPPFAGPQGGMRILHGVGNCTFVPAFFVPMDGIDPAGMEVADLDRDGVPDLIGSFGSLLRFRRMGHAGPIGPPTDILSFIGSGDNYDVEVVDLDVDGLPDIVRMHPAYPVRLLNALESLIDIGYGQTSGAGTPVLSISGTPAAGQPMTAGVSIGSPFPGLLFIGFSTEYASLHGGTLVPSPDLLLPIVSETHYVSPWPTTIPAGTVFYAQAVLATGGGQTLNSNAVVMIAE